MKAVTNRLSNARKKKRCRRYCTLRNRSALLGISLNMDVTFNMDQGSTCSMQETSTV
jgi:hypothetical protein